MKSRLLTTAVVLALCVISVQAQSGRKRVTAEPAAPVPTPTPEPTPTPKKEAKEPDLLFFVGADRNNFSANFPFTYYDAVVHGCGDRLRSGSSAEVDISDQSLSRGEAIKKAKASTDTYVVLLTLEYDSMARSSDDINVEFIVFAPTTGKVEVSGRSYLNRNRAGPISVPRGSSVMYREQLLKLAGEDAAKRILKSLHRETPKIP